MGSDYQALGSPWHDDGEQKGPRNKETKNRSGAQIEGNTLTCHVVPTHPILHLSVWNILKRSSRGFVVEANAQKTRKTHNTRLNVKIIRSVPLSIKTNNYPTRRHSNNPTSACVMLCHNNVMQMSVYCACMTHRQGRAQIACAFWCPFLHFQHLAYVHYCALLCTLCITICLISVQSSYVRTV